MSNPSPAGRFQEDAGTELESLEAIQARIRSHEGRTAAEPLPGLERPAPVPADAVTPDDVNFSPVIRPPTPRLTILDDGDLTQGETVRVRDAVTLIGRLHGQVLLPHDNLVSGKHAEIVREGNAAPYRWILRDLGSSNGTFVNCTRAILTPDRILILGSRRYRFMPPTARASDQPQADGTALYDARSLPSTAWPSLQEVTGNGEPTVISLRAARLSIGRPGCGNDIQLDDPLIARTHASVEVDSAGQWKIVAGRSKNGIWMQINAIRLTGLCRFQCGEQRFLFVV
jgi:pSer/pThr/pTyr-binding forkhead associated (FHA) protein